MNRYDWMRTFGGWVAGQALGVPLDTEAIGKRVDVGMNKLNVLLNDVDIRLSKFDNQFQLIAEFLLDESPERRDSLRTRLKEMINPFSDPAEISHYPFVKNVQ